MRHNKKFNHLSRTHSHRSAMLSNMATSLIMHKRIVTTTAKAKALRVYVEPLITKCKDDTTASRRTVFSYLQNKYAVTELFGTIAKKIGDRPGGYTRILKTGHRLGDNAAMCFIELVDFNENMLGGKEAKKTARTRRSRKKSETTAETPTIKAPKAKKEAAEKDSAIEAVAEITPAVEAPTQEAAENAPIVEIAAQETEKEPPATEEVTAQEEIPVETEAEKQPVADTTEPAVDEEAKE